MKKIKVTAQQRANAIEARDVMWPSVPPENVYKNLMKWSNKRTVDCKTHSCFGGWCAAYPAFKAQGASLRKSTGFENDAGPVWPVIGTSDDGVGVAKVLFGLDELFYQRGAFGYADFRFSGTDHELVTHRLNWLIENSEVTA